MLNLPWKQSPGTLGNAARRRHHHCHDHAAGRSSKNGGPRDCRAELLQSIGYCTVYCQTRESPVLVSLRYLVEIGKSFDHYNFMLNQDESGQIIDQDRVGVSREIARIGLPLSTYTQWYWKIDLHNLFHFLRLRADQHAQYEIRAYSEKLSEIVKAWVPMAYDAFLEHQMNGAQLSSTALGVIRKLLDGEIVTQSDSGLSSREWRELMRILGRE
jgi:hypothetical protein